MKRIIIFLVSVLVASGINAQVKVVNKNKLHKKIINYVETNYSESPINCYCVEYTDYNFKKINNYKVVFENGTIIEFYKNGNLKSIDCSAKDAIDFYITPIEISEFIADKFPHCFIMEYKVNCKGNRIKNYEVELTDDIYIKFDKNFKCIKVE